MLKLIHNLLTDYDSIAFMQNDMLCSVSWEYITTLNDIQDSCSISLGTKLKKKKIAWDKYKMNVSLTAQTLSPSVGDAICFLNLELQLPEFKDNDSTVTFIHKLDTAFDLLNSKNPYRKGSKAPVTVKNLCSLLNDDDTHGNHLDAFPSYRKLLEHQQRGGLVFPSSAVLKIIQPTKCLFRMRVLESQMEISMEKYLDIHLHSGVLCYIGIDIFSNSGDHSANHCVGESDHLTSLLRLVTKEYIDFRFKTIGKRYTEIVANKNVPPKR